MKGSPNKGAREFEIKKKRETKRKTHKAEEGHNILPEEAHNPV